VKDLPASPSVYYSFKLDCSSVGERPGGFGHPGYQRLFASEPSMGLLYQLLAGGVRREAHGFLSAKDIYTTVKP